MKRLIQVSFKVPASLKHEGEWYVASCDLLDVHSQGRDPDEAMKNLSEALGLFVESCFERGTLEDVLRESGFHPEHDGDTAQEGGLVIDVPLSLVANAQARAH